MSTETLEHADTCGCSTCCERLRAALDYAVRERATAIRERDEARAEVAKLQAALRELVRVEEYGCTGCKNTHGPSHSTCLSVDAAKALVEEVP